MHDCIVLGIVSESQTQILPRPIERAEVKFSLSDTFSFIFTMVSNRFVRECFVVVVFSNPCHFENHFGLFVHILLCISYLIKTIPHQGNFVTTFIISALAIWVLDGRFITNFVILNLSGSMKFTGQQFFSHVRATPAVARFLCVNQYYAKFKSALLKNTARWK